MQIKNANALRQTTWHALVIAAMLVIPATLTFPSPFWNIPRVNVWLELALAGSYAAVAMSAAWSARVADRTFLAPLLLLSLMGLVYLGVLVVGSPDYSRKILLSASFLALAGMGLWPFVSRLSARRFYVLAIVGPMILLAAALVSQPGIRLERYAHDRTDTVAASQQMLSVSFYFNYFPERAAVTGGAIRAAPDNHGYLLVTARGAFYRLSWDDADKLHIEDLHAQVPINGDDFDAEAANPGWKASFRVAGLAIRKVGSRTDIFVSHHYWKKAEKCFDVRISSHAWPLKADDSKANDSGWHTVFESRPCLPIQLGRGSPFAGEQIGGRLEFIDNRRLLVTMGDHQFDGWYKPTNYVQDLEADYGKTLLVDVETGATSIFTIGHRNAQGLTVDRHGRIWSTEHGPQGGDELNLLVKGGNYGYPNHTYGTEYGSVTWPPAEGKKGDSKSIRPVFAWVPSIGISEVVAVNDPAFARWQDDLLVASLRGQALWRVRIEGDRAAYAEPIHIGERLRDIAAGKGEFILWTDSDAVVRVKPLNSLDDGAVLFTARCGGCHRDYENRIGPTLKGVLGRRIASASGYKYSTALAAKSGRWTEQQLDAFLKDPKLFAPGNLMVQDGVPDSESRRKIIEYLRQFY